MPGKKSKVTATAAPAAMVAAAEVIVKNKRTYNRKPVIDKIQKLIDQEANRIIRAASKTKPKKQAKKAKAISTQT